MVGPIGRALGVALWGVVVLLPGESFAQPPVAPAAPPLVSAAAVLAKVQALYGAAHSFSADFAIVSQNAAYDFKSKAGGHVVFAAPGNSDWTWDNGNNASFAGLTSTFYLASAHKTYVAQVQNPYTNPYLTALAFLPGPVSPSAYSFELGASKTGFYGYVLVGKPRPSTPTTDYPKIVYYVDARSFEIERVLLVKDDGDAIGFAFTHTIIR